MHDPNRKILPGFRLGLTITLVWLGLLLVVPLTAAIVKAASLGWDDFVAAVWTPRARAAYLLTLWTSLAAAAINVMIGGLTAWVLVRYEFPGRRFLDAMVDLPLALPTAVAGLVFGSLYVENGWLGKHLVPMGFHGAYSRTAIVLVLVFVSFPFVVRAVQPVLESLEPELEEAAACLGASRWRTAWSIVIPQVAPALLTGFTLAFARCLGEYGSVVFVSGNMPFETEIAPVLIVARLEEFAYAEAVGIGVVLLAMSLFMLLLIGVLERRRRASSH